MQDRTNLTPRVLEQMRGEMIDLLSKYLEMDKDMLELNFEQEGDQVALMLSIPVIRAKDEEEIEAAGVFDPVNEEDEDDEEPEEMTEEAVSDELNDGVNDEEEAPKPKKRRSKKVTAPEELEAKNEENDLSTQESSDNQDEVVCEHSEG